MDGPPTTAQDATPPPLHPSIDPSIAAASLAARALVTAVIA